MQRACPDAFQRLSLALQTLQTVLSSIPSRRDPVHGVSDDPDHARCRRAALCVFRRLKAGFQTSRITPGTGEPHEASSAG